MIATRQAKAGQRKDSGSVSQPERKRAVDAVHALRQSQWVAFDLDDTLHKFTSASRYAARRVFFAINDMFGVPVEDLDKAYQGILARSRSGSFADGRSSTEHRRARFDALLSAFRIVPYGHSAFYADLYGKALLSTTTPAKGALDLLERLRGMKKNIAIVTEGPEDAQKLTLETLEIPYDVLVTSGAYKCSKADGLWSAFLSKVKAKARDVVVLGDSPQRDVVAAAETGCSAFSVHPAGRPANAPGIRLHQLARMLDTAQ